MQEMILQAAIGSAARQAAEHYEGERDRDSVLAHARAQWQRRGAEVVQVLASELEMESTPDLLDHLAEVFVATFADEAIELAPRGGHAALTLSWQRLGPEGEPTLAPPAPAQVGDAIVAWDPERRAFHYAFSPDYHQFGHAWSFDGVWRPICGATYRLASAAQGWSGGWDSARGALVAWNVDGEGPVGVVVRDGALEVLAAPGEHRRYSEDAFVPVETSGDTPEVEADRWEDLAALFGFDAARGVWVLLSEAGLWELDAGNRWTRGPALPEGLLPGDVDGDRAFGHRGAGAVWDGPRRRLIFWFASDSELHLLAWDGEQLSPVSTDGLPSEAFGRRTGGVVLAEHPARGSVVVDGAAGTLYRIEDGAWVGEPLGEGAPPRSFGVDAAFSPEGDALFGPGRYALEGRPTEQTIFFCRRDGVWSRSGKVERESPLDAVRPSGQEPILAAAAGRVTATAWRGGLHTLRWDDTSGWLPCVDPETGASVFGAGTSATERAALFEGPGGALHAVSCRGALFRLEDDRWSAIAADAEVFGERSGCVAVYDPVGERVVVWGGEVEGRRRNDTLVFEAGAFRRARPSPRPAEMSDGHLACFDTGVGRVVRLDPDGLSVLDGDTWRSVEPRYLRDFLDEPNHRVLAHDPHTRETLVVNLRTGIVMRLDVGTCDMVAQIEPLEGEDAPPFRDRVFDPSRRRLQTHSVAREGLDYALDLGPVFDLAASLGPRTRELPDAGPAPVRLYRASPTSGVEVFAADVRGEGGDLRVGRLGKALREERLEAAGAFTELAEARRAEGYVSAGELAPEVLLRALSRPAWELAVEPVGEGAPPDCRIGGLPSGIDAAAWPRDDHGEPLGFLFQVRTPDEIHQGGVAVFCSRDGSATNGGVAAVLLSPEALAAGPGTAPEGVPLLPVIELQLGERRDPVAEEQVHACGVLDGALGEMAEALAAAQGSVSGHSFVGGTPAWLQGAVTERPLLVQLDFDHLSLGEAEGWEDAGLFGVIYVFEVDGEAAAIWQTT